MLTTVKGYKVKEIIEMMGKEEGEPCRLVLDFPIQRPANQWNPEKKSNLIHSILMGDPIPPLYITWNERTLTVDRYVLDGLQRITTIMLYKNNKFSLKRDIPDVEIIVTEKDRKGNDLYDKNGDLKYHRERVSIAGKKFNQLPALFQNMMDEYVFTCNMLSQYTNADLSRIMYNLNNGQTMTATQKAVTKLGMELGQKIKNITENELFQDRIHFTKAEERKSEAHKCVLCSMMEWTGQKNDELTYKKLSNGQDLNKFITNFLNTWSEQELHGIDKMFTILNNVLPEDNTLCEKYLRANHLPVLVMNVDTYISLLEDGLITEKQYKQFLLDWFNEGVHAKSYTQYEGKNISDKANVEARIDVMESALHKYVSHKSESKG